MTKAQKVADLLKKQIYIAGPMTGLPDFNFEAFNKAAKKFRTKGYKVWNPAEKDEERTLDRKARETGDTLEAVVQGFDFREAYLWDLDKIVNGDGVYFLKGWEASLGARGEHAVALNVQAYYPEYQIMYEGN